MLSYVFSPQSGFKSTEKEHLLDLIVLLTDSFFVYWYTLSHLHIIQAQYFQAKIIMEGLVL